MIDTPRRAGEIKVQCQVIFFEIGTDETEPLQVSAGDLQRRCGMPVWKRTYPYRRP